MPARVTEADPRIDAIRGCVALERGPLVYCVETADLPAGWALEEAVLPHAAEATDAPRPELGAGVVGLTVPVAREPVDAPAWPYREGRQRGGRHAPTRDADDRRDPVLRVGEPIRRGDARLDPPPTDPS